MTKIALVTGGGLRIGKAVAKALADAGYAVAIHYNNSKDSAAALAAEITAAGGKAATLGQDLADIAGSQALVGRAAELMGGPISLLINSASLYQAESLEELTPEQWQLMTNVNAAAPIFLMQAFARQAPAGAAIVNMLDTQLRAPSSRTFSYFCAKAALETATKVAALELAPKIRVNGVAPGIVEGESTVDVPLQRHQLYADLRALQRPQQSDDVVGIIRFLLSDDAAYLTGTTQVVDGGFVMP